MAGLYTLGNHMSPGASYADRLSLRASVGQWGNPVVNQATANIASLALGAEGLSEARFLTAAPKVIGAAARFGTAQAVIGSSAGGERLSNALQALGVHNEFVDWLSSDPAGEPKAEARFKNGLDASIGGATLDMVFNTAKYAVSLFKGAPDVAAQEAAQKAAEEVIPQGARSTGLRTRTAQTAQVGGQAAPEDVGAGAAADGSKPGTGASQPGNTAGVQGVRFYAKPDGAPDEAYQQVGTGSKEDLDNFLASAEHYSSKATEGAPLDITEETSPEQYGKLGQFTFTPASQDTLAPLMRALADRLPQIDRPMSDEDLMAQSAYTAKQLGMDSNLAEAFVRDIAGSTNKLAVAQVAIRTQWAGMVKQLDSLAQQGRGFFSNLSDDDPQIKDALGKIYGAQTWGGYDNDIGTGLGRALRARQLPTAADYFSKFGSPELDSEGAQLGGDYPLPKNKQELDDWLDLWKSTGDDAGAKRDLLRGKMTVPGSWGYLRNSLANFYTGSLLAGKAIVKGWMMPAFVSTIRTLEKTSGGFLAAMDPRLSAEERQAALLVAKNAPIAHIQSASEMSTAWRFSLQAWRNNGNSVLGGGYSAKDAAQRLGPVTDQMLSAAKQPNSMGYWLGNLINWWPRQIFSLIGMHDEFTKRVAYNGESYVRGLVEASQKGLRGDDAAQYVRDFTSGQYDDSGQQATNPALLNSAARSSLINAPATGPMGDLINKMNSWRNQVPELRYILPVLNVPANGLGEGLRRIPILNYAFKETREDLAGNNGAVAQAEAYGRMLTGAAVLGAGFAWSRSGIVTGAGPAEGKDKLAWEGKAADGSVVHQPFSIKVPGVGWVSYKDYEPLGSVLGIISTVFDSSVHQAEDRGWGHIAMAGIAALAEYFRDKSALQSLSDVLSFGGNPGEAGAQLTRLLGGVESGFVPAFVKYIRNLDDPIARQQPTAFDYVINSLPETSKTLDPMRNVLGEPLHVPNDTWLTNVMPLTIAKTHPDRDDPVVDELDKVYELTGYAAGITNQSELSHAYYDARTVNLEDGRSMYDHWVQGRNGDVDGNGSVRQQLSDLFNSEDYKEATYGSPSSSEDSEGNPSKLRMIANVFRIADTQIKDSLQESSPIADKYLTMTKVKQMSPDILGGKTVDELVKTPSLVKALGIDLSGYYRNEANQAEQDQQQ